MPEWLSVIILGIVEGITEFLPVSSTGHLLIISHGRWITPQSDLFNIVIQSGAVLAVIPLFSNRCKELLFHWRQAETRSYLLKLILAFVITGVGGVCLEAANFTLPETIPPVAWALILGGILFVAVEKWLQGKTLSHEVTWTIAVAVGIGQLVAAIFPGASRSGTTILAALILGLARPAATEFSFLVGIPTMLAAGGLKILKALLQSDSSAAPESWNLVLLGTIVSALVSFAAVKWLLHYVQGHTFIGFGWYRMILGGLLISMYFA